MSNFPLIHPTLSDLSHTAAPAQRLPVVERASYAPKRLDVVSGRALECLAHAIEYIEDTTGESGESAAEVIAATDAVRILKGLNREIFAALPSVAPRRSLLRSIAAGWDRARLQGRGAL